MLICKLIDLCKRIKIIFTECLNSTKGEWTVPVEALETIARCVLPDIIKHYEEKRDIKKSDSEPSAHLTKEAD